MICYLDASALLRVLLGESGPRAPLSARESVYSSEVLEIEAYRTLDRARLAGRINDREVAEKTKELCDLLETLDLVGVSREVVDGARAGFPVPVRTLDAIHVATAAWLQRNLGEPIEFWTHDRAQANAALCRALEVRGVES